MTRFLHHRSAVATSRWAALLICAALAARALVPAGFMVGPVDGKLSIVLCEPAVLGGHHIHHATGTNHALHHHGDAATDQHDGPAGADCPYAQSAGPAPLPSLPVLAAAVPAGAALPIARFEQRFLSSGPIRQQTSRGPPRTA